jgi:Na+-driven multidrug efflux pump
MIINTQGKRREDKAMRAFFIACVVALILAIGGYYALSAIQEPVAEAFSSSAVRLNS